MSWFSTSCLGLLFLAVISTAGAQQLYAPDKFTTEVTVGTDHCFLPCNATTADGTRLPLPPRVEWQRQVEVNSDQTNSFVNIRNTTYWREVENVAFSLEQTRCVFVESKPKGYYDCGFLQKHCNLEVHSGIYQCVLYNEHDQNVYIQKLPFNNPSKTSAEGRECFASEAIQSSFSATYNESVGITLSWTTNDDQLLANQTICYDGRSFQVLVKSYRSYFDFITSEPDPDQHTDFVDTDVPNGTIYTVPSDRVKLGNYYAFDVRNAYIDRDERIIRDTRTTSLFFFGFQERPYLSNPIKQTTIIRATPSSTIDLLCQGEGTPTPSVSLLRSGLHITSIDPDPTVARKPLVVTPDSAGSYHCVAEGTYVRPQGGVEPVYTYKTIVIEIEESAVTGEMICAPHGDTRCSAVFGQSYVLVNTSNLDFQTQVDNSVALLDNFLLNGIYNASYSTHLSSCIDLAKAMLCHSAFPYCTPSPLLTRPICNNTCEVFGPGGACGDVLNLELFPDISELMFSNCDQRIRPAGESPECVHVPLEPSSLSESWCSRGDGQSYAGDVFVTSSGTICQDWVAQSPHTHFFNQPELLYQASRQCRNPGGSGEHPWCYTIDSSLRWEYCDVPQCNVCEKYQGITCSHLPGYKQGGAVYVDRHESEWDYNGVSRADLWMHNVLLKLVLHQPNLPRGCVMGVRELLCHRTLPLCRDTTSPSSLCSEHCKLSKLLQVCPQDLLRRLEGEMEEIGVSFLEPDCGKEGDECMSVQTSLVAGVSAVIVGTETPVVNCYNSSDNGYNYTGTVSTTTRGVTCQPWGPDFPELEANYCRNPGQVGLRPWCFTDTVHSEWDYCDIPECGHTGPVTDFPAETETVMPETLSGISIGLISTFAGIGILLILISMVLAIIIVLYCHRKQQLQSRRDLSLLKLRNEREWGLVVNETYVHVGSPPSKITEAVKNFPQYNRSSIKYIRQIGQGNFGVVFHAKAEGLLEDEKVTDVAVKTMKEENSAEGLDDFIREAKLMFGFDHPNIVKIFGVSVEDIPYYLIFEYMDKGDLAQFLRANASSLQRRVMNPFDGRPRSRTESTMSDEPPTLTVEQLTDICKQIANGMNYLAINNHVHRDLACRNCLVKSCDWNQTSSGLFIKIGDFGMSQNLYSSDYYRVRGQAVLPVRWMSPEAIIYGKFSTESDVWSFGVVMWEVFSFAMQPYYGTSNEEVTECIRRHKLLARPSDCPNRLYTIMEMCWTMQPKLRPTFEELSNVLNDCRVSVSSSEPSDAQSYIYSDEENIENDDAFYDEDSVREGESSA